MNNPIQAVLIGAGHRGMDAYGSYALQHPEEINFIAVAEPDQNRRGLFSARHNINQEMQFESWEMLFDTLKDGTYGRCVYHFDNDVVDHQVVSMGFEQGSSLTLTMHGHSHLEVRMTRIEASISTLTSAFSFDSSWIETNEHCTDRRTCHNTTSSSRINHRGGDLRLMAGFIKALQEDSPDVALTSA